MPENEKHKKLKLLGRVLLKDRGYLDTEIFEEHKIRIGRKDYIVDICGINPRLGSGQYRTCEGSAIAIECGATDAEKLVNLKLFFDEVIVLPYGISSLDSDLRITLEKHLIKTKALEKEVKKLNEIIQGKNKKIETLVSQYNNRYVQEDIIKDIAEVLVRVTNRKHDYGFSRNTTKVDTIITILKESRKFSARGSDQGVTQLLEEALKYKVKKW